MPSFQLLSRFVRGLQTCHWVKITNISSSRCDLEMRCCKGRTWPPAWHLDNLSERRPRQWTKTNINVTLLLSRFILLDGLKVKGQIHICSCLTVVDQSSKPHKHCWPRILSQRNSITQTTDTAAAETHDSGGGVLVLRAAMAAKEQQSWIWSDKLLPSAGCSLLLGNRSGLRASGVLNSPCPVLVLARYCLWCTAPGGQRQQQQTSRSSSGSA